MLYACGQGVGMVFWGIAEPIMMFGSDKFATAMSYENIKYAMNWTYFHWGIHAWVIYCIASICMAYSIHNSKKPLTYRDTILDLISCKKQKFFIHMYRNNRYFNDSIRIINFFWFRSSSVCVWFRNFI